jgi:hypothetical protein
MERKKVALRAAESRGKGVGKSTLLAPWEAGSPDESNI